MQIEHHSLSKDFPQQREQLHKLLQQDSAFARKADEYEALGTQICRIEDGVDTLGTATLPAVEGEHDALKHASGSCCGGCDG